MKFWNFTEKQMTFLSNFESVLYDGSDPFLREIDLKIQS